jgi:hypothetical protein
MRVTAVFFKASGAFFYDFFKTTSSYMSTLLVYITRLDTMGRKD